MKRLTLILCLFGSPIPALFTACATAPSERVSAVQTLKAVGQAAEAAVKESAYLYQNRRINAVQAYEIKVFYDYKFQPAFRLARSAVLGDLNSIAAPDVVALFNQLLALVSNYQNAPSTTPTP